MKIYVWVIKDSDEWCEIVLWDGENTYWSSEMIPSPGYDFDLEERTESHDGKFIYIGEL